MFKFFHFSIHKIKNVSPFTNQIVIIFIPIHPTTHQETSSPGVVYTCVTLQQRNDITQLTRPNNRHNRLRHLGNLWVNFWKYKFPIERTTLCTQSFTSYTYYSSGVDARNLLQIFSCGAFFYSKYDADTDRDCLR